MSTWDHIENIVTLIVCGMTIVGLYWLGAGLHCFWALALLLNISSVDVKKTEMLLRARRNAER